MAYINLSGLFFPAMTGFLIINKRLEAKAKEAKTGGRAALSNVKQGEMTSVDKYLENHAGPTGVDKYIDNVNKSPASGVTRYLLKQTVAAKIAASQEAKLSGVAKYLKNQKDIPPATGVTKYLINMDRTPATGVAKYVARQIVTEQKEKAPDPTGVEKYLAVQLKSRSSSVTKYMAKVAIAEREAKAKLQEEAEHQAEVAQQEAQNTGVAKYLREHT
jgi:hypothetical protein